mgnify:CR=1 FL=1
MPFTKAQRNFTKITFALVILFVFGYIIIYADQFKYEESYIAINQNFVDTDSKDINSIDLNDVTIDEDIPGTLTYIVKNWDTLWSVALKFWTTVSNLKKVNQLQGRSIRVGMKLKITEEEWIIYQLPTDTNLLVFANQYNLNVEDLKNLNYIQSDDQVFKKGDDLFIPISEDEAKKLGLIYTKQNDWFDDAPVKPKTVTTTTKPTTKAKVTANISSTTVEDKIISKPSKGNIVAKRVFKKNISNSFYAWFCTWYAATKRPDIFKYTNEEKTRQERPFGWNAREWYQNAKKAGLAVGSTAKRWALITFRRGWAGYSSAGHVWYVLEVDTANNRLLIEDMNYLGKFIVTQRYIDINEDNIIWYIY